MTNYEPAPMSIDDLEDFNHLFHVAIGGIEEHLTGDQLNPEYVTGTLLALGRQLDRSTYDVGIESRRQAHELAVIETARETE